MKDKRGVSGVIVTVLLVMIAIVLVGLISVFIINFVNTNLRNAQIQSDCLAIELKILNAKEDQAGLTTVSVQYSDGLVTSISGVNLYTDGVDPAWNPDPASTAITRGGTQSFSVSFPGTLVDKSIYAIPIVNGTPCSIKQQSNTLTITG